MAENETISNGDAPEPKLKIYFLPNLLTAGNLFCGFVALTKIVEADLSSGSFTDIKLALAFILAACVFDLCKHALHFRTSPSQHAHTSRHTAYRTVTAASRAGLLSQRDAGGAAWGGLGLGSEREHDTRENVGTAPAHTCTY